MNENPEKAHQLVDQIIGKEKVSFDFEWDGQGRVPETVIFPDGSSKEVGYMRDGMINFQDGTVGTYERVIDDPGQSKQKIKINITARLSK